MFGLYNTLELSILPTPVHLHMIYVIKKGNVAIEGVDKKIQDARLGASLNDVMVEMAEEREQKLKMVKMKLIKRRTSYNIVLLLPKDRR